MESNLKNVPYKKAHINGVLINAITKEEPYLHKYPSTSKVKKMLANPHPKNNKRGIRLVVTNVGKGKFTKTVIFKQYVDGKFIQHYKLKN